MRVSFPGHLSYFMRQSELKYSPYSGQYAILEYEGALFKILFYFACFSEYHSITFSALTSPESLAYAQLVPRSTYSYLIIFLILKIMETIDVIKVFPLLQFQYMLFFLLCHRLPYILFVIINCHCAQLLREPRKICH